MVSKGVDNHVSLSEPGGNVNVATQYISGCLAAYTSVTVIAIGTGACRDDTNADDIVITATRSADITTTGAGGRNVDSAEAADTWYYIFIIDDSTGSNTEAAPGASASSTTTTSTVTT